MLAALAMMTIRQFLPLCGFVLVSAAACASNSDTGNAIIDYQLSSWSGVLSAHISDDGAFTRTKLDGSTVTGSLGPAAVDDLQSKVNEAQFPTLEDKYGCGGCADQPVHRITVHLDDNEYTVRADDGSGYPARLQPLIDELHALVQEPPP